MKNVIYMGLEDIKNNGISDWLKKESTQLVASHVPMISFDKSWLKKFLGKTVFLKTTKNGKN